MSSSSSPEYDSNAEHDRSSKLDDTTSDESVEKFEQETSKRKKITKNRKVRITVCIDEFSFRLLFKFTF